MRFELKKIYNFVTLAPSILGNEHKLMKVAAIMNSAEALKQGVDITTRHDNVLQVLPSLPTNITDLIFILFVNQLTQEKILLAYEYINLDSIENVEAINIRVDIYNTSTEDISVVNRRLRELGYANIKIKTF